MVKAYLIFLHLFAILAGVNAGFENEPSFVSASLPLVIAFLVVLACKEDAKKQKLFLPRIFQFIMLFTWVVTAPAYLIWSRGLMGVLWALMWAFTIFVIALAIPATVIESLYPR